MLSLAAFILVVTLTRFVSLGSIIGAVFYPIQLIFIFGMESEYIRIFSIIIPLIVIYTHRKNIDRLLKGEESKIKLAKNR
ncbi:MAG: glycerol-3-phosphate acyltransferase, partial [Bacteroidia bacterium]